MQTIQQTDLITLRFSKENEQFNNIKSRFTNYAKFFYNHRQNALIVYDNTNLYIFNREQMKNFNVQKQYLISELAYNSQKDIVTFLTAEGILQAIFLVTKSIFVIKKDIKKNILFDWTFNINNIFHFFIAEQTGVKLFKIDEQKKSFKQVKNLSGKYNSFLYQASSQTLVGFPVGDCRQIHPFLFNHSKYSNWFRLNLININFTNDQNLTDTVKIQKSLCLDWSKNNKQIFTKNSNEKHFTNLIKINKRCYLIFFFAQEGLLKIFPIIQQKQKQISVKLPSDSIPDFNVIDNMLVVHLKVQKITFIYDLNGVNLQPLVSPYPLRHKDDTEIKNVYQYSFIGQKAIHPKGKISKWEIQLQVIYNYLKNELQIFDFLIKRKGAKMEMLKWLRRDLFKIKQLNLSKFWKTLFIKYLSNAYPQIQVINLIDLFSNVFYTLSKQQLIPKQKLLNIILECLRQALQLKVNIPLELQYLTFEFLIQFKKYQILIYLSHNDVIKDSQQILKKVLEQYFKNQDMMLATLAVDMTYRIGSQKDMLKILMKLDRIRQAKKYIKQYFSKIETLYLIEAAGYIKNFVILEEYLKYIKSFILQKYPTLNIAYLNQAQQKIRQNMEKLNQNQSKQRQ